MTGGYAEGTIYLNPDSSPEKIHAALTKVQQAIDRQKTPPAELDFPAEHLPGFSNVSVRQAIYDEEYNDSDRMDTLQSMPSRITEQYKVKEKIKEQRQKKKHFKEGLFFTRLLQVSYASVDKSLLEYISRRSEDFDTQKREYMTSFSFFFATVFFLKRVLGGTAKDLLSIMSEYKQGIHTVVSLGGIIQRINSHQQHNSAANNGGLKKQFSAMKRILCSHQSHLESKERYNP